MENEKLKKEPIQKALLIFNAILVAVVITVAIVVFFVFSKPKVEKVEVINPPVIVNPFDNLELQAKAVYIFDLTKNKALFKKNEFTQLPLASVTKLMTALTATEILPKDSQVIIKNEFLREEGDTGLLAGESWKIKDLLDFSLVASSNDGARAIASVAGASASNTDDYDLGRKDFVTKMNDKAQELDLKQTYFINEDGLDQNGMAGGYGSAIDVEKLVQYIMTNHPDMLEATKYPFIKVNSLQKKHTAKNTDTIVNEIPGLIASKTGYTDLAGGNLVVAFDASIERPIIVVVLGSTEQGRFDDVSKLVKASLEYISQ